MRREVLPGLATPMVVAHAGGSVLAGGDLFVGIDRAAGAGVPLIELDVRRTGDDLLGVHYGDRPGELSLADVVSPSSEGRPRPPRTSSISAGRRLGKRSDCEMLATPRGRR